MLKTTNKMKKTIFPILMLCISFTNQMKAEDTLLSTPDNVIYVASQHVTPGEQVTLSFQMKNTAPIRGFQFDLYLPDGFTAMKNSKGKILGSLSKDRQPEDDEHTLSMAVQPDGAIRFLCGSMYDDSFTGSDGEIATLQVGVSASMIVGDYPVILRSIKLTESDISKYYETSEMRTTFTVGGSTTADVNGDGIVNALDIQSVINAAAIESVEAKYDVNSDGKVNALDIQEVINISAATAARQLELEQMKLQAPKLKARSVRRNSKNAE